MKIFIWLLFALAVFVNLGTLKDGHNWGDDFAQYIINARNIMEGKPFMSGVMLEPIVIYPPGLPLLLVPVLKVFGLNFKILKLLNIFCWYLSIIFLYLLFLRTEGRRFALMAAVFLAFSSYFFVYKQNVLSDIPFFLFVCSSFYALERWRGDSLGRQGALFFAGFLFSISAALWIRSAGVTLFAAALFYFIFIKHDRRAMAAVLTVFILNEFLLFFWVGWHPGFFASAGQNPQVFFNNIFDHFSTVFRSLWYFFCPLQSVFSQCLFNKIDLLIPIAAPFLYLMIIWSFIRGFQKKDLSYMECFSFLYLSLLIFWSGNGDPFFAFTRFVLPLLPFAFIVGLRLFLLLKKFKLNCRVFARLFFLTLVLINIANVIVIWNFNDDVLNAPINSELFHWVRQNMKPDERFMFSKPRAMALLTQREGTAPWIFPGQQRYLIERIKYFNISYVVSSNNNAPQGLTAQMENSGRFKLVWENAAYKIFRFLN